MRSSFFAVLPVPPGLKEPAVRMVGYSALKIEVDFNFLRGVLAAFSGAFVDKDFLYKLVEHGVCQSVKILILIN